MCVYGNFVFFVRVNGWNIFVGSVKLVLEMRNVRFGILSLKGERLAC